jgi:DNA modification methylase
MTVNKLILGDNLEILKTLESESVDLIYLDPPFFSNRNYEVIWGDEGEVRSFQDRWSGGMEHYIAWLKERVEQMHRVLKPTGSIFLHCDWHANAYIRVQILDRIFGSNNFRNEIIWKRKTGRGETNHKSNKFGTEIDTIFFYAKSNNNFFESQFSFEVEGYQDYVDKAFNLIDENGRKYQSDNLSSPTPRPNLMYEYKGYQPPKNGWAISLEKMEQWDKEGRLLFPKDKNGRIRRKRFLDELKGKPIQNLWTDIEITSQSKERIGYPTQKPEALLQRIIECASNEGDIVLDPFVGGGTTVAVADKLNRKWIGIDQSVQAVKVTELRLDKQRDLFSAPFTVQLHKYDYDTLRYKNAFEFEEWIVQQFGGTSNTKQRNDFGLDGKMPDNTPIQVKRSDNIGRNVIDNFFAAVQRSDKKLFDRNIADKKPVGYIIAFSFGKGAVQEVARLKLEENIVIRLISVEEIVPIAKKPILTVESTIVSRDEKSIWEIQLIATGTSEAGIEFYSWNFNYNHEKGFKADIMIDKEGKQIVKFKAGGTYNIAVKVVDNDGLESVEVVKLKVNGNVERLGDKIL